MELAIPLDKMTTKDKLLAIECLWDDLCRKPDDIPSPPWHREVLVSREKRGQEGKAQFTNLEQAKDRIRKATR